ncbi:WD40/YVTN/BNR-like repeat-containing protein [Polyangium jinanense]|uniref:Uncharacterized protein n=1 Tax=Polyangium jinanense TaxID=2829994 RepID=A0A9X4AX59_9BACT|nr:hypothetical protein [Polyangium jinanense]MDC3958903.1 hypothetical protein [Polyangium jinanense]MDC3986017.1 hypothetical protein [Polyangium jinanense]
MLSVVNFVRLVKVAAWAVFLLVFPPIAFANGMYAATVLLAVLGLLLDVTALGELLPSSTQPKVRRGVVATMALLHISLLALSVVRLVSPRYGAWQRIAGTDEWNNAALVRPEHGPLLAVGHRDVLSLGKEGRFVPVPDIAGPVHVIGAGAHRAWFVDVEGQFAWGYDGASLEKVPLGWDASARMPEGAALDDAFFVVGSRGLVRVARDGHQSKVLDGTSITGVATDGSRVVAVGSNVFVSEDGGRHFKDRGPTGLQAPSVYAGGGSYYLVQGGIMSSRLFVSEADGRLEERKPPMRDIRVIAVDPHDGRRVWVGTWGEGIWRSEDAGRTFQDLELEGLEVQSLVVDFSTKDAWVAATNLATPSGVYHYGAR